ncbi:peptidase family M20/M25/M40 domain protein, partial [Vibrio parahaemolyticus VPTS-2010_2]
RASVLKFETSLKQSKLT